MSPMFEKIKDYYDNHYWKKSAIGDAVEHNYITAEEYEQITGEEYVTDENRELTPGEFVDILVGGDG